MGEGQGLRHVLPARPWITTHQSLEEVAALAIRTTLDGELRQDGNTKDMILTIPELVAYISSYTTLLPGDVILTGTPSGVGPMLPGQEVSVEIEGIGTLTNPVAGTLTGGDIGRGGAVTEGDSKARDDFSVPGSGAPPGAGPVSSVSDGQPACRQRAQRAVQLGVRQALLRDLRAPVEDTDAGRNSRSRTRSSTTRLPGWARPGTRAHWLAAHTVRTFRPSAATSIATLSTSCVRPHWRTAATARGSRSRLGKRLEQPARRRVTTVFAATSASSGSRSWKRGRRHLWSECGCPMQTSPSMTWCAVRAFAAAHVPDYVIVRAAMANRSTPSSTQWTTH